MRIALVLILALATPALAAEALPADLPYTSRVYTSPDGKLAVLCVDYRFGDGLEGFPTGNPEYRTGRVVLFRNDETREIIWEVETYIGELFWEGETVPNFRVSGYAPEGESLYFAVYRYSAGPLGILSEDGSRLVLINRGSSLVNLGNGNSSTFHPDSKTIYEVGIYRDGELHRKISDPYFVAHPEYRKEWDAAIVAPEGGSLTKDIYLSGDTLRLKADHLDGSAEFWHVNLADARLDKHWVEPSDVSEKIKRTADRHPRLLAALAVIGGLVLGAVAMGLLRRRSAKVQS